MFFDLGTIQKVFHWLERVVKAWIFAITFYHAILLHSGIQGAREQHHVPSTVLRSDAWRIASVQCINMVAVQT